MKASEANKIANESSHGFKNKNTVIVLAKIREAANAGRFYINTLILDHQCIANLKEMGYDVTVDVDDHKVSWEIVWEKFGENASTMLTAEQAKQKCDEYTKKWNAEHSSVEYALSRINEYADKGFTGFETTYPDVQIYMNSELKKTLINLGYKVEKTSDLYGDRHFISWG